VLLEGVFDFLAGLLEIGFDLMAFTLGLQPVVAGGVTGGFLALAVECSWQRCGSYLPNPWRFSLCGRSRDVNAAEADN